ncbi:LAME_0A04874g1_1 [Lachancea meyersii CBS 8951]|uniref:LAME_0A04874g1_1 n=1 Tax=Lachancea meyersii CBS 8951 TaxID=1266667 RepID=A0A1G4IPF1_9SACH|nr:LAME_0A04874g1_1 [Lachancea meyersii CBS 8951]
MSDPRTRKARHTLTPDLLSSSILITNLPANWNETTISSVVAGSGPITNISRKTDPRNGKLVGILVDYLTSKDSKRALELLRKIKKFSCDLERIISNSKNSGTPLNLNRDAFPWDFGLELPFEMVSEVPLPRRPTNPVPVPSNGTSTDVGGLTVFPDILSKASKHLPGYVAGSMTAPDAVSSNLSKIAPLQLLEMISNFKILAGQDANRDQLTKFLTSNPEITIAVTQAMLEMGFINYSVVTKVIADQNGSQSQPPSLPNSTPQVYSGINTNTTPMNGNAPLNIYTVPLGQPQPLAQPLPQPQPSSLAGPNVFSPPPQQQQTGGFDYKMVPNNASFATNAVPMKTGDNRVNMVKLAALPQNQQDMIKQVLQLTADQIRLLPPDQVTMVENFKREYLM